MIIFIIGTGSVLAFTPPKYWYSGSPAHTAAAFATAKETDKIAFAPRTALFFVPSAA